MTGEKRCGSLPCPNVQAICLRIRINSRMSVLQAMAFELYIRSDVLLGIPLIQLSIIRLSYRSWLGGKCRAAPSTVLTNADLVRYGGRKRRCRINSKWAAKTRCEKTEKMIWLHPDSKISLALLSSSALPRVSRQTKHRTACGGSSLTACGPGSGTVAGASTTVSRPASGDS